MSMTPSIIKQVHKFTELDHIPKGLKITNNTNEVLVDSAAIAGVDYDAEEFDDHGYSTDEKMMTQTANQRATQTVKV
eukprot:11487024-Ditylum_brightwellii.AAC.1